METNIVVKLKKCTFVKDGKSIEYVQPYITLDDKDFNIFPSQTVKQLFKYLLNKSV